jgi:hypothetical protein
VSRGVSPYLRVEKPCFLFLEGSAGAVGVADVATAAPPDASAVRAGTSAARATSLVGRLATGAPAPAPGACSLAVSAVLGEGGAGSHLSGRARSPSLSSSSSPDDESSEVAGGESPCCSRSRNSLSLCSRCSRRRILFSFLRAARSCSRCYAAPARPGSGRGRIKPRGVHGHHLQGMNENSSHAGALQINSEKGGRNPLTNGP